MAKRSGIINTAKKVHPIGRLKSPITHLMGAAFQSQHVRDMSNQSTLHGAPPSRTSYKRKAKMPRLGR